jgi:Caspase domain
MTDIRDLDAVDFLYDGPSGPILGQAKWTSKSVQEDGAADVPYESLSILLDQESLINRYVASQLGDCPLARTVAVDVLITAAAQLARKRVEPQDVPTMMIGLARKKTTACERDLKRDALVAAADCSRAYFNTRSSNKAPRTAEYIQRIGRVRRLDPAGTRAVVVGASRTRTPNGFEQVPGAEAAADALSSLLTRRGVEWQRLSGTEVSRSAVLRAVGEAARDATDTVLLYYTGHGTVGRGGQLLLHIDNARRTDSALTIDQVRGPFDTSQAKNVITILDCCSAGQAQLSPQPGTVRRRRSEYLITAVGPATPALAGSASTLPAFTSVLVEVLSHGIPGGPRQLGISDVFGAVSRRLKTLNLPAPSMSVTHGTSRPYDDLTLGPNPYITRANPRSRRRAKDTDADRLVREAADGDAEAWDSMVRLYGPLVWARLRDLKLSVAEAAETSQLVWLRLIEHLTEVQDGPSIIDWLTQQAHQEGMHVLAERPVQQAKDNEGTDPTRAAVGRGCDVVR